MIQISKNHIEPNFRPTVAILLNKMAGRRPRDRRDIERMDDWVGETLSPEVETKIRLQTKLKQKGRFYRRKRQSNNQ